MSDIVERLRSDYRSCGFCRLERKEGADEIKRLRKALREIVDLTIDGCCDDEDGSLIANAAEKNSQGGAGR